MIMMTVTDEFRGPHVDQRARDALDDIGLVPQPSNPPSGSALRGEGVVG